MSAKITTLSRINRTLAFCLVLGGLASANAQGHWEVKPSNSTASLNAVVFGNGLFVAVGDNGTIVTSPDGETWTSRVSGTTDRLPAVTFGKGRFVATRENRAAPILTSTDGITWSPAPIIDSAGAPGQANAWKGIAFGQGRFLSVGAPSRTFFYADILGSDDGITFKVVDHARYPQPNSLSETLATLYFFHDRFYARTESGRLIGSVDGVSWNGSLSGTVLISDGLTKFATLDASYYVGCTFSLNAGHTVHRAQIPPTKMMAGCYASGRYVGVDYKGRVWISETNGEYWRGRDQCAQNGEEFRGIAFDGGDRLVAVGSAPPSGSALLAVAQVDPLPSPGPGYTVYALKDLSNGAFDGKARAISNTGFVGGSSIGPNKQSLGAIYHDGATTTYPDPVYHSYPTVVTSVNDAGAATLQVDLGYPFSLGIAIPQMSRTFPTLYSTATSITSSGWIVGTYRSYDNKTRGIYRYNPNTDERVDLGNFGLSEIEAMSMNESGDIAGTYVYKIQNSILFAGPFRLSAGGGLSPVPTPPGPYAEDIVINSHGDVAGSTDLGTQGRAFLFKDGVTSDIDFGSRGSATRGMNNNADVVGYFDTINPMPWQSQVGSAFLYRNGTMYELNHLLDQSGDGWFLREATAINDNGWIVGEGYRHGFYLEPFLAIPNGGKPADRPTRFINLSTRLRAGTDDNALIAGFVLRGGPRKLVIRAIGPGLGSALINVPNPLPDSTLQLFNERGEQIAFNDDYAEYPYFPTQNEIGVYGLTPPWAPVIRDSVIMTTLPEGSYTAVVRGKNGATGNALVEVYNIDPDYSPGLVNIATRGPVGAGDDVMIAGFIVSGEAQRRVLVRAIGPGLAASGVPNPLADPVVEVHDSNGVIAQNDNWKSDQETEIRAAGFAPPDDRDAALIVPLWPGTYTAIVRGKGGMTGNAIVEVYTLPD